MTRNRPTSRRCGPIPSLALPFLLVALLKDARPISAAEAASAGEAQALLRWKATLDDIATSSMSSWLAATTPCKNWNGIFCNGNGDVIGINLTSANLKGTLDGLNFSSFPNLQYIDFGINQFYGTFPSKISQLSKLTYLDLSFNNLSGKIPPEIGQLTNLQVLRLVNNTLSGPIPDELGQLSQMNELALYENNLEGFIPAPFGNLTSLERLFLYSNSLSGSMPPELGNMSSLEWIYMDNNRFTGLIPSTFGKLRNLTELHLYNNQLTGNIPPELGNLNLLNRLSLYANNLTGSIPPSLGNLTQLTVLYLYDNGLSGNIPKEIGDLLSLTDLELSKNNLTGPIPSSLSNLSNLQFLFLGQNQLNGTIPEALSNLKNLLFIRLGMNNLTGPVPSSLGNLSNLKMLNLRQNQLNGTIPEALSNLKNLVVIQLDMNNLTGPVPSSWGNLGNLQMLFLSHNQLNGTIPENLSNMKRLVVIQIDTNNFTGPFPDNFCNGEVLQNLTASGNSLVTSLKILDMSNNGLTGDLSHCVKNFSANLVFLNLRMNKFHGVFPEIFPEGCRLTSLDFSNNNFDGPLPRSLLNCQQLEVLATGRNRIVDFFPNWLEPLPLKVLSLRFNNFHGRIGVSNTTSHFSDLRILDLSSNRFDGPLPDFLIDRLFSMTPEDHVTRSPSYIYLANLSVDSRYFMGLRDPKFCSVRINLKGTEIEMAKINVQFATLDLSCNNFGGEIPRNIGLMKSLKGLNFSHNYFMGMIPPSVGDMVKLESLDLSYNSLVGEIPKELTKLTSLGALDLSWNNLTGPIPSGGPVNGFPSSSFERNDGLCGIPLAKACDQGCTGRHPPLVDEGKEHGSWFEWKFVVMGFANGVVIGFSIGYMALETGRPLWLARMVILIDANSRKSSKRKARRRNTRS